MTKTVSVFHRQMLRSCMNYDAGFWRRVATTNVALYKELESEFKRHEEAMRKLIIKFSVERS